MWSWYFTVASEYSIPYCIVNSQQYYTACVSLYRMNVCICVFGPACFPNSAVHLLSSPSAFKRSVESTNAGTQH